MKIMKLGFAAACVAGMVGSSASAAVMLSKDVRGAITWDNATVNTWTSSEATTFRDINNNDATGLGQSFTSTATGDVTDISFGFTRFYAGNTFQVQVWEMFGGDGVTPEANPTRFRTGNNDWTSLIKTYSIDSNTVNINNSGDGNNMVTLNLTGADQFTVTSGSTYLVTLAATSAGDGSDALLWDYASAGNVYAGGIYGVPGGGVTVEGRELGLAVNVAVPEPASLALIALGGLAMISRRR